MEKLKIEFTIFFIFVVTAFSLIVINEKIKPLLVTKVDDKLESYIKEKYPDLENVNIEKTTYKINIYQKNIINKENKHLYFNIYYKKQNKKITDNYKTNYVEGKEFLNYIYKKINKQINNNTKYKCQVTIKTTYNKFNTKIQERLLKEEDLLKLSIYTIKLELETPIEKDNIINTLKNINKDFESNNIIPKDYTFTIIDPKDITKSIEIKEITPADIKNDNINAIISNGTKK